MKKTKPIKSAVLCLDIAIKQLKKGKDATSALFQCCMQLAQHSKNLGLKREEKMFKERAKIFRLIKQAQKVKR